MLKALRDKYEMHHKVTISDDAIEAAVKLSSRYVSDRFRLIKPLTSLTKPLPVCV